MKPENFAGVITGIIVALILIFIGLAVYLGKNGHRGMNPPPISIEKCDDLLIRAYVDFRTKEVTEIGQVATACYLSHLVDRRKGE